MREGLGMTSTDLQEHLYRAIVAGDVEGVQLAAQAGADLNKQDIHGDGPLCLAMQHNQPSVRFTLVQVPAVYQVAIPECARFEFDQLPAGDRLREDIAAPG